MKRIPFLLLCSVLSLQAQVEQLATSSDGRTLLFHSYFRLQTESDLGVRGKIYRWQNGEWTRLAAAQDIGFALSLPDVYEPFLSSNGRVAGWQINVGCILCQLTVAPPLSSAISGVSLPAGFPRSTLRMSANGRYFTADSYPFSGAKYLDAETGAVAEVPLNVFALPPVREVSNDGTVLLLVTAPRDWDQVNSPGTLSLWKPGSDPRPIYSENRVFSPTISAEGGRVAFEAVVDGGPNDGQRTVIVLDTRTGEQIPIAPMPSKGYRAFRDSFSKPVWDASGTKLIYRRYDDQAQPTGISLWDSATRESRTILTSSDGFTDAVISGDGKIVWAVTRSNRVLRLELVTGVTDEILSPLGSTVRGADGIGVPGSAILIRGTGFTKSNKVFEGVTQLPLVDAETEGLWLQIPWEYSSLPQAIHKVLIRSEGNPFEGVIQISVTPGIQPHMATWFDSATARDYAKAIHEDFQNLVTPSSPARAGETIHVYLTGLGPLDQPLPTGVEGPVSPAVHPIAPLNCRLGLNPGQQVQMPYLGYAAGMIGIYQADITLPDNLQQGTQTLNCGSAPSSYPAGGDISTTSEHQ